MMTNEEFKEKYQAAIPACCELKTIELHASELMMCWGLVNQVKTNGKPMDCGMCDYNTDPSAEIKRKQYFEERRKEHMWNVLTSP